VLGNVRFGSKADIGLASVDVRYSPESGHCQATVGCPFLGKADVRAMSRRHEQPVGMPPQDCFVALASRRQKSSYWHSPLLALDFLPSRQFPSARRIECLRTALRVAPDYVDAMFNLALLLQRTSRYAEAADYWRRYLANDRQSEWAARARRSLKFCEMQINLAAVGTQKDNPDQAA
jgi:hypothetical protein